MNNFSLLYLDLLGVISHNIQELESRFILLKPYTIVDSSSPSNRRVYITEGDSDDEKEIFNSIDNKFAENPEFVNTPN